MNLVETRFITVAVRMSEPYLRETRFANELIWSNRKNWKLGFYFGKNDTRLWVPRRLKSGLLDDENRVINFAHPLGKGAFKLLMLGYLTGIALVATLIAAALGYRW